MAVTGHVTPSMFDRYNIVSEDDLRMADQKTTMYVGTLPCPSSGVSNRQAQVVRSFYLGLSFRFRMIPLQSQRTDSEFTRDVR
jgi:hypothetical protein